MTLNPLLKRITPVHLQDRTTEEFHLWEVGAIKLVPLVTADPENLQLQSYCTRFTEEMTTHNHHQIIIASSRAYVLLLD